MEKLRIWVDSLFFSNFILIVVFVNSVTLGLQTSNTIMDSIGEVLSIIDKICLWIFAIECILKLIVYRHKYFSSGWNWFDFLIVLVSFLSDFSALSSMRAFRIVRVFRALKVISGVKNLQLIVSAIGKSLPSIGWTSILMLLIYYIFAVIGTMLFAEQFPNWFGTLGRSMYSLFQVMTLESWSMGISRPVMDVYPYAWIYFVPFVILSSFVVLNIVVGIVVTSIGEATTNSKQSFTESNVKVKEEIRIVEEHLAILKKCLDNTRGQGYSQK